MQVYASDAGGEARLDARAELAGQRDLLEVLSYGRGGRQRRRMLSREEDAEANLVIRHV
jgi:hypothetical protein